MNSYAAAAESGLIFDDADDRQMLSTGVAADQEHNLLTGVPEISRIASLPATIAGLSR